MDISSQALNSFAGALSAHFQGQCEMYGMLAENNERARQGQAPAYTESDFARLADHITDRIRQEREWIR